MASHSTLRSCSLAIFAVPLSRRSCEQAAPAQSDSGHALTSYDMTGARAVASTGACHSALSTAVGLPAMLALLPRFLLDVPLGAAGCALQRRLRGGRGGRASVATVTSPLMALHPASAHAQTQKRYCVFGSSPST